MARRGIRHGFHAAIAFAILMALFGISPLAHANSKADAVWNGIFSEYRPSSGSDALLSNLLMGVACANLGKLTKSADYLSKFEELSGASGKAQVKELLSTYKNALQVDGSDLLGLNILAFGHAFGTNDYEESARYLRAIIRLDPDNVYARDYLGLVLGYCDKVDEAIATLKEALQKFPKHEYTHFLLALAYRQKGQFPMMMSELAKSGSVLAEMTAYQLSRVGR